MIYVTYVSENVRGERVAYDTDDTGEALSQAALQWWGENGVNYPQRSSIFAVVIERDGPEEPGSRRIDSRTVAVELEKIAERERFRASRDDRG